MNKNDIGKFGHDFSRVMEIVEQRVDKKDRDAVSAFIRHYYQSTPKDDFKHRNSEDLYGAALSCWNFIQQYDRKSPKVRVYNPDFAEHGWQSSHSVVEVLHCDIPFLVDSIRMEINRRGLGIHTINHSVITIERSRNKVKPDSILDEDKGEKEAIFHAEIDRHSDEADIEDLQNALVDVINEVAIAVADFGPLKKRTEKALEGLKKEKALDKAEIDEAIAFVEWMMSNHFTFLGTDEFSITEKNGERMLNRDAKNELGIMKKMDLGIHDREIKNLPKEIKEFIEKPVAIAFSKASVKSRVHRPAYFDYIVIKQFDSQGRVSGGLRIMGLFTASAYQASPADIPILRQRIQNVFDVAGVDDSGHRRREIAHILEVYPRDELYQIPVDELSATALGVLDIQERRQTKVFINKYAYSLFLSCTVYIPRETYNTELRQRIQEVLTEYVNPRNIEFTTFFSESILARTHFVCLLKADHELSFTVEEIEEKIRQVVRSWTDDLADALVDHFGEEKGLGHFENYKNAFDASYTDDFSPRTAAIDIDHIRKIKDEHDVAMVLYKDLEAQGPYLRFKMYNLNTIIPLSDVIPILENMGLRVLGEHPYDLRRADGDTIWIHDFTLEYTLSDSIDIQQTKLLFQDAFKNIWQGQAENDGFNRLVLGGQFSWREIAMLRAYARYMKQIRFGYSEHYIADTLSNYIDLTDMLVKMFQGRFDPNLAGNMDMRNTLLNDYDNQFVEKLEKVSQLSEDRILRKFQEIIKATLRTNFYQKAEDGTEKDYFSFKINPQAIQNMPLPRPMFEIFVYSPRVEGVHLRGGKVARGGLRWSDRLEDFRTEVLGLVKAQQVKNAVIVPVGAKGGFVAKQLSRYTTREDMQAEGIASYKIFISALLDLADNLVDGKVIPPEQVIRHDENDTYLVVAADKGTATFSDIANGISEERGFWLGDAFASGGSVGYDHKKMGITAKGAWVSVQRHFREKGINVQEEEFTVVAVGDMAGDVFGNGMLCSDKIRLVAAFNHLHIFIDPNPESAASFEERKRMFELPGSSWEDYNKDLISAGGGVFSRGAKSIAISPQMKERFGLHSTALPPNELISAILKSKIDLIWNGGIGTYIKATEETHEEVGDKANDSLRINGNEVNAKVIGEGGNLGVTQRARIEYGLNNGSSFTDFIDNAGGVDCSDHEVNIKILLNQVVDNGDMTVKQRNQLLMEMTEDVSRLVLNNNYKQTQAIALAKSEALTRIDEYIRLINEFESEGKLDRELEFLPDNETLQERKTNKLGLTRPELSVLISYTKADLKEELNTDTISNDEYLAQIIETEFPDQLLERFKSEVYQHRLRSEIIATQLANDLVNHMGITYMNRMADSTGCDIPTIAKAYVAARDMFQLDHYWKAIEALDYEVPSSIQEEMMGELMRLVRRASRWLLRNRRSEMNVAELVGHFGEGIKTIIANLKSLVHGTGRQRWEERYNRYIELGVNDELATVVAGTNILFSALGIIGAAEETGQAVDWVAKGYFALGSDLDLDYFNEEISRLPVSSHWSALARESFRDDLDWQQRTLTVSLICQDGSKDDMDKRLTDWKGQYQILVDRWMRMVEQIRATDSQEFAMYSVALRELLDLAQTSRYSS